ncbi:MAG: FadR family transcriptional regulator [Acidobacteria bacterium]|nr:FadR family transcriptional regulator [Acidobacteriota bacterium]
MAALERIPRPKIFEEVAGRLDAWIRAELRPGDRLPPERELVSRFGVSRSSIRDAIHKLQLEGLIETHHGLGSVVAEPVNHLAAVPIASTLKHAGTSIADLMDFRRIIEPPLAARAALRATPAQRAALAEIVAGQASRTKRGLSTVDEDTRFHSAIARAANNPVVLKLLDTLMGLLLVTRQEQFQSRARARGSLQGHLQILAAIQASDSAAAEAAMARHLHQVEAIIDPAHSTPPAPQAVKKAHS